MVALAENFTTPLPSPFGLEASEPTISTLNVRLVGIILLGGFVPPPPPPGSLPPLSPPEHENTSKRMQKI